MRAIQMTRTGGPEVLETVDLPTPEPDAGQVRIRHEAIGMNFIEAYQRTGLYAVPLPTVLGSEASGVVEALGAGVTTLVEGDRVAFLGSRAYAEASVQPAERVVKLPDGIDARTAAGSLLKGMTAESLLRRVYPVKAGETVLIHAAAGGVGSILVQWAKTLGATVIATAGSEAKRARARMLGADHALDAHGEDMAARVREITGGEGVRVVYDGVGDATFDVSLASLGKRGTLALFGNASGPVPPVDPLRLSRGGSLYLTRPTLFDYVATPEELRASATALFDRILVGDVRIEIGAEFPLERTADAHRAMEGRETTGSTLLIP